MLILMIRTISVAKNHWFVHICIGLEMLLMDQFQGARLEHERYVG
jgi:hypothetical protein